VEQQEPAPLTQWWVADHLLEQYHPRAVVLVEEYQSVMTSCVSEQQEPALLGQWWVAEQFLE
jgi:hypothetical protein